MPQNWWAAPAATGEAARRPLLWPCGARQLDCDQFLTGASKLELLAHLPEVLRHHVAHVVPIWATNLREKTSLEELGMRSRQLLPNLGRVPVRANRQLAL